MHRPSNQPLTMRIRNSSNLSGVKVHVGELCVATVGAKKSTAIRLPATQLDWIQDRHGRLHVRNQWHATVAMHGSQHTVVVARGVVGFDGDGASVTLESSMMLNEAVLGMSFSAYKRIIEAQLWWRWHHDACAKAKSLRQRKAAAKMQCAMRDHLHRAPRTCFICLDSMPWATSASPAIPTMHARSGAPQVSPVTIVTPVAVMSLVPDKRCHRMCPDCARQHVDLALEEGRMHVRCPGEGCKHLITDAIVVSPAANPNRRCHRPQAGAVSR